ncbi:Translin [Aaosphaeria arxii CBS 175.79]|uniref:Translin n=1 Tax=Aaosphaeria arxii CBS 175.79 TaxID=1450172 RepID=A0A6A5Y941_9PLEO|nr:Translin [Aaosphaeria arxii CBS 175.79]KAF2021766.1 Translin [Aaosphaeria arxii CBS 175.79]
MADSNETPSSPFMPMFEEFRKELDEHHDRRERVIKASRDVTASSKKIIFTLQRIRTLGATIPAFATKNNAQYWETIQKQYQSIATDVQGINAYRYPQITGGNQEFMEALSFQHYLENQTLISYEEARSKVASMSGEGPDVLLTPEDYILGIFDMIGELMRFSITCIATNGKLPAGRVKKTAKSVSGDGAQNGDQMDVDQPDSKPTEEAEPRNVLSDLREIRLQLEMFEAPDEEEKFYAEVERKMSVMRQCVNKVEKALYSLTVRGKERPKGWVPDVREERPTAVEGY